MLLLYASENDGIMAIIMAMGMSWTKDENISCCHIVSDVQLTGGVKMISRS